MGGEKKHYLNIRLGFHASDYDFYMVDMAVPWSSNLMNLASSIGYLYFCCSRRTVPRNATLAVVHEQYRRAGETRFSETDCGGACPAFVRRSSDRSRSCLRSQICGIYAAGCGVPTTMLESLKALIIDRGAEM